MRLAQIIKTMHESMDMHSVASTHAVYHRLLERGTRVSAIAAMSADGVIAVDLHQGISQW